MRHRQRHRQGGPGRGAPAAVLGTERRPVGGPLTFPSFTCPGTVHLGHGASAMLPELVPGRFFLFTGSDQSRFAGLVENIESAVGKAGVFAVSGEPTVEVVVEAAAQVKESRAQCVVAIGGGSVMDAAKAAAALATNKGPALDYLEVVGKGLPLVEDPLPVIAVPTTFGTGSEVTRNAVIGVAEHRRKVSMRDQRMVPRHAVIDPGLAKGLPSEVAAYSAIDALVHVCEAYVCNTPCKIMDPLCEAAAKKGFVLLARYCDDPDDESRQAMAEVSLCGGLMIANAKLGAVHGFAGVIGGMTGAAHGKICAALFAQVFAANVESLGKDNANKEKMRRYGNLSKHVTGERDPGALLSAIEKLVGDQNLPGLGGLGVKADEHGSIVEQAKVSSSMKGNPVQLSEAQLQAVLARAQ